MQNWKTEGLAEFLEKSPLYSWQQLDLPEKANFFYPGQMTLFCSSCGGNRPFRDHHSSGSMGTPPSLKSDTYGFRVYCGFCNEKYSFYVEVDVEGGRIRKIGQVPPVGVDISQELARHLGQDAALFRKGMVCLNQGYGLAACAYFRRLLESKVDAILKLLSEFLQQDPSTADAGREVDQIRKGKIGEKKLERAAEFLPATLLVAEENPLKLLYGHLSVGIHGLPEDQCVLLAQEISETLQFVLLELSRVVTARERFAANVRNLRATKSTSQ